MTIETSKDIEMYLRGAGFTKEKDYDLFLSQSCEHIVVGFKNKRIRARLAKKKIERDVTEMLPANIMLTIAIGKDRTKEIDAVNEKWRKQNERRDAH